jgi:cell division protein FtsB
LAGFFKALGDPMNLQKKWGGATVGLIIAYLIVSGNRGLWNLYKLHEQKQILGQQITRLNSEIDRYQMEYQDFEKNNIFVEKQAREELSLVKPGEIVYKFTPTENR